RGGASQRRSTRCNKRRQRPEESGHRWGRQRRRRWGGGRAATVGRRRSSRTANAAARAEVYPAAASLYGGDARQGTGGERYRTAVDLRVAHRRPHEAEVVQQ